LETFAREQQGIGEKSRIISARIILPPYIWARVTNAVDLSKSQSSPGVLSDMILQASLLLLLDCGDRQQRAALRAPRYKLVNFFGGEADVNKGMAV